MKHTPDEPLPLGEAARADARLRPLAKMVDAMPDIPSASDIQLARTFQRLRVSQQPPARLWFGFRFAPAAAILLLGTTVGASAALVAVKLTTPSIDTPAAGAESSKPSRANRRRRAPRPDPVAGVPTPDINSTEGSPSAGPADESNTPAAAAPAPALPHRSAARLALTEPPTSPRGSAHVAPMRRTATPTPNGIPGHDGSRAPTLAPPATTPPATVVSAIGSLSEESNQIAGALAHLRRDREPQRALSELDRYLAGFPTGVFRDEATLARAEALLALDRRDDALAALEILGTRRPELAISARLLRAEIISATNCQQAIVSFTEILVGASTRAADQARALHGRAMSRILCGDSIGGRGDLKEYLDRFPDGAGASAARTRLGR